MPTVTVAAANGGLPTIGRMATRSTTIATSAVTAIASQRGERERHAAVDGEGGREVRAQDHQHRLGEVHDARALVDDHEAEPEQRVQRALSDAAHGRGEQLLHLRHLLREPDVDLAHAGCPARRTSSDERGPTGESDTAERHFRIPRRRIAQLWRRRVGRRAPRPCVSTAARRPSQVPGVRERRATAAPRAASASGRPRARRSGAGRRRGRSAIRCSAARRSARAGGGRARSRAGRDPGEPSSSAQRATFTSRAVERPAATGSSSRTSCGQLVEETRVRRCGAPRRARADPATRRSDGSE